MLHARSIPASLALAVALLAGCGHPPPSAANDVGDAGKAASLRLQALETRVLAESPPAQIDKLVVRRSHVDNAGDAHVVLDAWHGGYRVFGAGIIRHERADGTPSTTAAVDTRAVRFDDTPPAIDASRAEALARDALADQHAEVRHVSSELVYERDGDVYRLVHHVDVGLDPRQTGRMEWTLSIDARDGRVLQRRDVTQHTQGTGHGYWYGTEPIQTFYYATPAPGYFTLEDKLRPSIGNRIYVTSYYTADGDIAADPVLFTNPTDDWGNGMLLQVIDTTDPAKGPMGTTGQTAAVDGMVAAANAWDMFVNIFGSPGPFADGKGFRIVVNADQTKMPEIPAYTFLDNTVWINVDNQTCAHEGAFGTVGHELGHAWFDSLEGSPFTSEGAAMNEATGDIIGKLAEIYGLTARGLTTQGPANPSLNITPVPVTTLPSSWSDWTHRECPNNVRYMNHPSLGTGTNEGLDAWSSAIETTDMESHKASGPISRMFYFLSEGVLSSKATGPGEHSTYLSRGLTGIGIPKAADVFYRAFGGWLPAEGAKFADLRAAMEQAAGSDTTTKKAVQDAFAAVNVGPPADRTGPTISGVTPFSAPNHPVGANVSDPSGVKSVRYMARSAVGTVTGWGTATAAPWSVLVPASTPSGSYTVSVCALDQLDNQACVTASVTIDASAPVISTFVVTNPWVSGNKTVHLVATDANLSSASISLDGTAVWQVRATSLYPLAPKLDMTPTITLPAGLTEGTHTLTAVARDHFLSATKSTTFLWDTTPPDVCDFNVDPRTVFGQSATTNGEAGDHLSGISLVSFTLDGADVGDYPLSTAPGSVQLAGARWDNEPVGPHTLTITCKDRFGLTSSKSKAITISAAPLGAISAVTESSTPTHSVTYHIHVADSDGLGTVFSDVWCGSSGDHVASTNFTGNPTTYDQTITAGGLTVGESCTIYLYASDRYKIDMPRQQVTFTVTDPVLIWNDPEPAGDPVEAMPSTVRTINGTFNGHWTGMGYLDEDFFTITIPAGKTLALSSNFDCNGTYVVLEREYPGTTTWEDDTNGVYISQPSISLTTTSWPGQATTVKIGVLYDWLNENFGGSPDPTRPPYCDAPAYSLNLSVY